MYSKGWYYLTNETVLSITEVEVCGKGWYYNADSGACEACPLHTYKETHGNHGCSDCPSTGPRNRTITTETGVSTRGKCSPVCIP